MDVQKYRSSILLGFLAFIFINISILANFYLNTNSASSLIELIYLVSLMLASVSAIGAIILLPAQKHDQKEES